MNAESASGFVTPSVVISHFHIKEGDVVADFGAGNGYFLPELSRRVASGQVYACEIQKSLVEKVGEQARSQGLRNVHPLWCDLEEPNGIKIKDGALDVGILVNTLFQIENKAASLEEMSRTLKKGARLIVIDWTDSFNGMGPAPAHIFNASDACSLFESNGFVLEKDFPAGSHHYGLAFRKV